MSWKGFQKGLVRTPQNLKHKLKLSNTEKDEIIRDAEERFASIENLTRKLHEESKRYYESINNLLAHQIRFSDVIETLYNPIYGRFSDKPEDANLGANTEGILTSQKYRAQVTELQTMITPELEMIETRILKPADDLLSVTKTVRKMFTKRNHKRLDLDRQEQALKKLQDRTDRNAKQEEKMYKVENDYEMAREEFDYYDDLINMELPKLFTLEADFIKPLFQSFYFMQLNIFYTMHSHMETMKIPYFDLQEGITQGFERKHSGVREQLESLSLVNFKASSKRGRSHTMDSENYSDYHVDYHVDHVDHVDHDYGVDGDSGSPPGYDHRDVHPRDVHPRGEKQEYRHVDLDTHVDRGAAPPLAPPRPRSRSQSKPKPIYATALYDYTSQNMGDISFKTGDQIRILKKSDNENDWWTGELNGIKGFIPSSYVKL